MAYIEREQSKMHNLPETGFLRLYQIIGKAGNPNSKPPIPPSPGLIPVSKSTWWAGVKSGRYPKPVRSLGERITVWRVEDIRALIEQSNKKEA
jgi:prophage regulatory protein